MKEGKECILYINVYYIQEIGNVIFYNQLKVFKLKDPERKEGNAYCTSLCTIYNQLRYDD